jgi:hypothetical protein
MAEDDFETLPIGTMDAMAEAARTFREYESQHRGKAARVKTDGVLFQDHEDKARRNASLADKLEKLLAKKRAGM